MSSTTLDLDIQNYSINDIEKFFGFRKNQTYTTEQVELKEASIREQLLSTGHIDKRFKANLIAFLTKCKDWLIYTKCPAKKAPSLIPSNYRLDTSDQPKSRDDSMAREQDLIRRKDAQYIYTNTSEFFRGSLNELDTRIITKYLNIDTRFRPNFYNTNSSDFTIQLPEKLNKVVSMQMSAIEFPQCYYGISSAYGNNAFTVTVDYKTIDEIEYSESATIIVKDSNYTALELINQLNLVVSGLDTSGNQTISYSDSIHPLFYFDEPSTIFGYDEFDNPIYFQDANGVDMSSNLVIPTVLKQNSVFTYVYFDIQLTLTGSGTGQTLIGLNPYYLYLPTYSSYFQQPVTITSISLDFTSNDYTTNCTNLQQYISTKIGWNLGFQKAIYQGRTQYNSETIIEPSSIRYIYIAVDDYNRSVNNQFIDAFGNSLVNSNILARISMTGTFFTLLVNRDMNVVTEPRKYFGPVDIQKLRIRIYDDHGRILNINNANYSFCLVFKMLYDL